jgi:uncharacterized Ntn-hydrolase superfamily protein
MTFSIVARSAAGDAWGVAVASKFLAVGSAVPAARVNVGAIATQSFCNTLYKRDGLGLLANGRDAQQTLDALTGADDQREERQAGIVDGQGGAASFTGSGCLAWAGGITAQNVAIQGNILTGPEVVEQMHTSWRDGDPEQPLARRLLAALKAGDRAGGDSRGRQSAALLVVAESGSYTPGDDVVVDLRVDDHADPCTELERLLDLHQLFFERPKDEDMVAIEGAVADQVAADLEVLGFAGLDDWVGVENYEMRVAGAKIDRAVLDVLSEQAARRRATS